MKFEFKRPFDSMGVRALAREIGISPTTVTRLRQGHVTIDMATMIKVRPYLKGCPFCDHKTEQTEMELLQVVAYLNDALKHLQYSLDNLSDDPYFEKSMHLRCKAQHKLIKIIQRS